MAADDDCTSLLRTYIARADREDIATVQTIIMEEALRHDDRRSGIDAMTALSARLVERRPTTAMSELQQAFETVVVAMIERTRTWLEERPAANAGLGS